MWVRGGDVLREVQAYEKDRERKEGEKVEDGEGEDKRGGVFGNYFFFFSLKNYFLSFKPKNLFGNWKKNKKIKNKK